MSHAGVACLHRAACDPHSCANIDQVVTDSVHLHVRFDFDARAIRGFVEIRLRIVDDCSDEVTQVRLDCKDLIIDKVCYLSSEHDSAAPAGSSVESFASGLSAQREVLLTHHIIASTVPALGNVLCIALPPSISAAASRGRFIQCRIYYATTEKSAGVQWLTAAQTAQRTHPFAYTQGQAILARTLFPCQDTPAGHNGSSTGSGGNEYDRAAVDERIFHFVQRVPVPAYLLTLACGALECRRIGPRSIVWAEPCLIERAVHEFAQTEDYLAAGELITGVLYQWESWNITVLPSAFPYGGMENPNNCFLNASLLAGDRSLTNVLAHEIAHSWSGNLVTNSSWRDFWLNEGFTVYLERQILAAVAQQPAVRDLEIVLGVKNLEKTVADLVADGALEWTKLRPDLDKEDPDDSFSKIPYEKGSIFLLYLEHVLGGGTGTMNRWLHSWFTDHSGQSVDAVRMRAHFEHFVRASLDETCAHAILSAIAWDEWWYGVGMPPWLPTAETGALDLSLVHIVDTVAAPWLLMCAAGGSEDGCNRVSLAIAPSPMPMPALLAKQRMYLLDVFLSLPAPCPHAVLDAMDCVFSFSSATSNVEIACRWLVLSLKANRLEALVAARTFLSQHGRGLYVKPVFGQVLRLDRALALEIASENASFWHAVIQAAVSSKLSSRV